MMSALHQYNAENASPARSALNAAYRRRRLHMMLSQEVPDLSAEVDPDRGDLQDYKFLPGDIVYLVDRKRDEAERWRVATVFDEMISLQSQEQDGLARGNTRWQKCDTDKLVLEEVYLQLARNRIRRELLEPRAPARTGGARGRGAAARAGPEGQDPEQAWQGQGTGAPQEGTGEPSDASSDVEAYGDSEDDGADLYT